MNDLYESVVNSVNAGDKFLISSTDTKNRFKEIENKWIIVKEIITTDVNYSKVKYIISDENFMFNRGCGEMPLSLLTGTENSLGDGRFQYMVSKLN